MGLNEGSVLCQDRLFGSLTKRAPNSFEQGLWPQPLSLDCHYATSRLQT